MDFPKHYPKIRYVSAPFLFRKREKNAERTPSDQNMRCDIFRTNENFLFFFEQKFYHHKKKTQNWRQNADQ